MSRSFKKNPVHGVCVCRSEKEDKRIANRTLRANVRGWLATEDPEKTPAPKLREVSNVWTMGKDGKVGYWGHIGCMKRGRACSWLFCQQIVEDPWDLFGK